MLAIIAASAAWLVDSTRSVTPVTPVETASIWSPTDQEILRVVDADWLSDALADSNSSAAVVDLSSISRYELEHIPGAVHVWWQDGMDPHARVYGERYFPSTDPDGLATWFASLGIDPGETVVVYDDEGNRDAARLVWLLANAGHDDAVILDGGLATWKGAGFDPEAGGVEVASEQPEIAGEGQLPVIDTGELSTALNGDDEDLVVIDMRSPSEVDDTLNGTLPVGRIPGSVSLPYEDLYQPGTRLLLPPDEIRAMLENAGINPSDTVVVYGQFGIDTGLMWLILDALGYDDVRIYDQGWVTWAADPSRPIEELSMGADGNG